MTDSDSQHEAMIPISELEALVDKWRNEYSGDEALKLYESARDVQIRECANELQALIDNYD